LRTGGPGLPRTVDVRRPAARTSEGWSAAAAARNGSAPGAAVQATRETRDHERVRLPVPLHAGPAAAGHGHAGRRAEEHAGDAGLDAPARGARPSQEPGAAARDERAGAARAG